MRIFPAYARAFSRLIQRGLRPSAIGVLLSSRWWYYQNAPRICIRPDEWMHGRFEFGYLRNQHVVAIWGDEATREQFAWLLIELMRAQPRLLWIASIWDRWIYKEDYAATVHDYATLDIREREEDAGGTFKPWKGPSHNETMDARRAYESAQRRAQLEEQKVMQRLTESGGDLVKWYDEQQAQLAAAERAFSEPNAIPEDAVAA